MKDSNFSPQLIGVTCRLRSSQNAQADRFEVSIPSILLPKALSYPVPQHFADPRRLRTPSEAIASRLAYH
jgi:hypothetical protein